uniref:type II secretion system protein N n=1 Tax=Serratia quinivorans TaxID=137545 RepID=UPI0035C6F0AB
MQWLTVTFRFTPVQYLWLFTTLLLLVACGQRLWALWPQAISVSRPPVPAASVPAPLDVAALQQLALFQTPSNNGPAAFRVGAIDLSSPQLRNAPISTIKARLTGVISGSRGIAVVEFANRQGSYGPGDTLAGEAELVRIFSDRIIISRRGQYEALPLN